MRTANLILLLALAGSAWGNWPQWRGPNSNGTATGARSLPVKWTQTENVLWRTKMPSWSAATPIVWNDTVFVTSAEEGFLRLGERGEPGSEKRNPDKIYLIALNRKDGSIRWRNEIDSGNRLYRKQNSASPSPITDGERVWIMTGNGKFACFTMDGSRFGNGTFRRNMELLASIMATLLHRCSTKTGCMYRSYTE